MASGTSVPINVAASDEKGLLSLPTDVMHAGWWDGSARVGDPLGSIVVAAHVDSLSQGLGVFAELLSARVGDRLVLSSAQLTQRYRVVRAHLVPKVSLTSSSRLYTAPTIGRLVLITCGGTFDPSRGGYQDNFVVVAEPTGPVQKL